MNLPISVLSSSLSGEALKTMIVQSPYHSGFIKGQQKAIASHLADDGKRHGHDKQKKEEMALGYIFGARMARKFAQAVKNYSSENCPEWSLGYGRGYQFGQIIIGEEEIPEESVSSIAVARANEIAKEKDLMLPDLPVFKDKNKRQVILGLMLIWFQEEWKTDEQFVQMDEKVGPRLDKDHKKDSFGKSLQEKMIEASSETNENYDRNIGDQDNLVYKNQDNSERGKSHQPGHSNFQSNQSGPAEKTIVVCPECQQKLRVSKGKTLSIFCPSCVQIFTITTQSKYF